jgi:hypothetical protein
MNLKKDNSINYIDNTIFILLYLLIPIDLINGYFINIDSHLPIALIYKLVLIIFISCQLFHTKHIKKLPFFYFFYFIFIILYNLLLNSFDTIFDTITHFSKFFFIILIYFYFIDKFIYNKSFYINKIYTFLLVSSIFLFTSLLFGILGFGFSTYSDSNVGNKSFFNGGNDLAIAASVLFAYNTYLILYFKYNIKYKYLIIIFLFLISISISTKVALISSLLSIIYVPTLIKSKPSKITILRNLIYSLFLFYFTYRFYLWFMVSDAYNRIFELYEKVGGDFLFIIFSGRQFYVENALEIFFKKPFYVQFFGLGRGVTVEMDFVDTLLNYGYFGVVIVYSFYFMLLFKSLKFRKDKNKPFPKLNIYLNLLLTFISLLSGHLIFSAMAGVYISAVNSLNCYAENSN